MLQQSFSAHSSGLEHPGDPKILASPNSPSLGTMPSFNRREVQLFCFDYSNPLSAAAGLRAYIAASAIVLASIMH